MANSANRRGHKRPVKEKKTKTFLRRMKKKLLIVFGFIMVALIALGVRISFINYTNEDDYTKLVLDQQQESSTTIPFRRGDILDRNGNILATSIKVYNLILDPKIILREEGKYQEKIISAVVEAFGDQEGVSEESVREAINKKPDSHYVVFIKALEYDQIKDFKTKLNEDGELNGLWFEDEYQRRYPNNELASSTIGFTEAGNVGRWGIEESYNDYLNGTNGRLFSYYDNNNQQVVEEKAAENGSSVVSTIDITLQQICQKWVEKWVKDYNPKNVSVMITDPNNGEILAMVSSKNIYDLNNPRDLSNYYSKAALKKMSEKKQLEALSKMWRNYCISDSFEAGSTIKPFTVAGALEENAITEKDTFMCDGGEKVSGFYVRCHQTWGHGRVNAEQSIMYSCNDGLMQIAEKEGIKTFCRYQDIFNFGMKTRVDLPGETSCAGLLYNESNMTEIDLKTNSFGQNFNVTMVQMMAASASLINGGYYYEPHVVKQVISDTGAVEKNVDKVLVKQTITKETSDFIKKSLASVVTGGTGGYAAVEGYVVGGKTGTAQKHDKEEEEYILSFLGYAPYENPQLLCYVCVDAPDVEDNSSSSYASKLFSAIMTEALPAMNIFPSTGSNHKKDTVNKDDNKKDETTDNDAQDPNDEKTRPSYDENPGASVVSDEVPEDGTTTDGTTTDGTTTDGTTTDGTTTDGTTADDGTTP